MSTNQAPIGHLDADCFYCSAERVRDEDLAGIPIGVLGNKGACVIAKSYEMKATGVKTGEAIWDAMEKCPDGVYIKRDFRWYETLSRGMLEIVREFSPRVEYHSIDEFFFEARPTTKGQTFGELATAIRDRIWESVEVPVTVGIARSRTLAKLISDSAKPFGARAVLDAEAEAELLAGQPVTEITGIAARRARTLELWGIRTALDFARADRGLIRELLTASGEALWWELNGDPVVPIDVERKPHKFLSRGGSFGDATAEPAVLYAWLVRNLERLIEELEYHEVRAGRLTVWVAYRHGEAREAVVNLPMPSERFDALLDAGRSCLRRVWIPKGAANRMQVIAGRLTPAGSSQLGLFDGDVGRAEAIAKLKREINQRHGRFVLRSAATLPLNGVTYGDEADDYDICDVRGKTCF